MTPPPQAILAPLIYYDLLDRPLTAVEIFKYLRAGNPEISFFSLREFLKKTGSVSQCHGLYFLPGRQDTLKSRQSRLKFSQLKWKKLKSVGRYLALAPFLRLAAVTGSLTAYNAQLASDFDLLIILKRDRLWLGRLLLTLLIGALGKRRHGALTQNRLCLNCYLTEDNLEITGQAKPRDFHSAQEYGRLAPLLEIQPGLYKKFIQRNLWLADFLQNYPWPNEIGAKKIRPAIFFSWPRQIIEWLLAGWAGERLEKLSGRWQKKRINQKRQSEQPGQDQIFISDTCLMFHPQSKSARLMREFNIKMEQIDS